MHHGGESKCQKFTHLTFRSLYNICITNLLKNSCIHTTDQGVSSNSKLATGLNRNSTLKLVNYHKTFCLFHCNAARVTVHRFS
jgi:hypothetical protein